MPPDPRELRIFLCQFIASPFLYFFPHSVGRTERMYLFFLYWYLYLYLLECFSSFHIFFLLFLTNFIFYFLSTKSVLANADSTSGTLDDDDIEHCALSKPSTVLAQLSHSNTTMIPIVAAGHGPV